MRTPVSRVRSAVEYAGELCAREGTRFTPLRRRVLEIIWKHARPVKAYDVLTELSQEDASAQPPTVYRTLEFLLEHRLIHRVETVNAYVGCAHPNEKHHCNFLICTQCEQVEEWCAPTLAESMKKLVRRRGFFPEHQVVEILGVCRECAKKRKR